MPVYKSDEKTKDGRMWYFKTYKKDFQGNNKAYKSKKYATKSEAQEAERLFLIKRDNPTNKPFPLIADDYFKNAYKVNKETTVYCYESCYNNHIKHFFSQYNINEIDIKILKHWKEYMLEKELHINTLNNAYGVLNNIFNHAITNYGLQNNCIATLGPFHKKNDKVIPDSEKLRYITHEHFLKFLKVINDDMWKTFFTFLYYTGMRKGEVQALTWKDIDFQNSEIIVNKTLSVKSKSNNYIITSTKTKNNRKIKMSSHLKDTLIEYKTITKKYKDFSENWFVFGNSRFLPQTTIDRYKHNYFNLYNKDKSKKEQIKEITIHEFRHSHVSLLINEYIKVSKEKNLKVDTAKFFLMMSDRMGHSIQVMQNTYMHLFPTIQDEIVDLLDNL